MGDNLPTVDIKDCRDMLDKLLREIKRIETCRDRQDAADHCCNAALTAWHLHDWVWRDIKTNWDVHAAICRSAGLAPCRLDEARFGQIVLDPAAGCAALDYCQQIATASKHAGVEVLPDFEMSASPEEDPRWKIRERGKVRLAIDVFEEAFAYWNQLIRTNRIADSGLGKLDDSATMPSDND
jgi:hypothetical protein